VHSEGALPIDHVSCMSDVAQIAGVMIEPSNHLKKPQLARLV